MPKSACEIVKEYLVSNGFDGLAGDGCGCGLDALMVCAEADGSPAGCVAAKLRQCTEESCMESLDICGLDSWETCRTRKLFISEP